MNLIGYIGNFFTTYQEIIMPILVIVILLIIVIALVRTFNNIEKNKNSLEEISTIVAEINKNVEKLGKEEKKGREVIYIDNRNANLSEKAEEDISEAKEEIKAETEEVIRAVKEETVIAQEEIAEEKNCQKEKAEETIEETIPEIRKYFGRNDSVSKNGKKYTKEELEKQIR